MWLAWRTVVGVRGRRNEVASASSSSSSGDWTQGGRERTARCLSRLSALAVRLRLEDARVRGVLEMECDWLLRTVALSGVVVSLEKADTALTLDWGRGCGCGCECSVDDDEGGGMGDGSSLAAWGEAEVKGNVEPTAGEGEGEGEAWSEVPWGAASGRAWWEAPLLARDSMPWSDFGQSSMDERFMLVGR